LLTIIYGILIFVLIKKESFKKMIYLSISILLLFLFLQAKIFDNLGYPVTLDFPNKFNILYVKKIDNQFIVLVENISNDSLPRLYKLKYSKNLEDILNEVMAGANEGKRIIGVFDNDKASNPYGISIEHIKKVVPAK
jgi:hypothetical protein|tara:strand:- start:199 stop:609 length:411 start_codon:yes stop_codon:yes gene_type:complete